MKADNYVFIKRGKMVNQISPILEDLNKYKGEKMKVDIYELIKQGKMGELEQIIEDEKARVAADTKREQEQTKAAAEKALKIKNAKNRLTKAIIVYYEALLDEKVDEEDIHILIERLDKFENELATLKKIGFLF